LRDFLPDNEDACEFINGNKFFLGKIIESVLTFALIGMPIEKSCNADKILTLLFEIFILCRKKKHKKKILKLKNCSKVKMLK
jgi:hypothetical protein